MARLCGPLDGRLTQAGKTWGVRYRTDPLHTRLVLFLATALLAPPAGVAQVAPRRNALGLDSLAFADLQALVASQDSVRVRGTFGQVVIRAPTLTTDSLLPATDNADPPGPRLGLSAVTRIQVRGGASGTGALVGAGVGLAGGLAAALGLSASLCSDGGCSNEGGGTAVITLGSTAAGALLGALLGAPLRKWHTVYEGQDPAHTSCLLGPMGWPPNKRLKLAGGDRFKGTGVLCPCRDTDCVHHSCADGRVARSLSAIRWAAQTESRMEQPHGVDEVPRV